MFHEFWNCLHWPFCPGVLIAILAFLTAFVAFRIDKANRVEKAVWTFVFLMLVVGEIWMMGIERQKSDKDQDDARTLQLQKFQEIANELKASNTANLEHFDATITKIEGLVKSTGRVARTTQESLAQVTGNGQFCYLMAITRPGADVQKLGLLPLYKMNSGRLPLDECHVMVSYNTPDDPARNSQILFNEDVGPIPPRNLGGTGDRLRTNISVKAGPYFIEIHTRNNRFFETLILDSTLNMYSQKIEVRNQEGRVVYSFPDAKN